MIDNNNPDIDVDEIMAKIRAEIAERKGRRFTNTLPAGSVERRPISSFDRQQVQSIIRAAEVNADIVSPDLPMARFPGVVRRFARMMGRVVLYLSRFITVRQANFNQLVLQAFGGFDQILREQEQKIAKVIQNLDDLNQVLQTHEKEIAELKQTSHDHGITTDHLKSEFTLLQRQVASLLEETRKRLPEQIDERQLSVFSKAEAHLLDAFYANFTDKFRGSREDIKERLKVYLPIVQDNNLGLPDTPVLDLGCGRGEWLEILKNESLSAQGVDINQLLIEICRENDLEVFESDIFDHLRSVPDQSLGCVTAFHLVEHLSIDDLVKLLDEIIRVLKSGGVVIFETPNPENVLVGSCNFYYDPTHRNPIPPKLLKFLIESRGFCRAEIMLLHPYDESSRLSDNSSEFVQRFNDYFYGSQDYAVYGFKT